MSNIVRRDPFEDLFRGFFVRPVEIGGNAEAPQMRVDVKENPESYTVHAELPGVTKDDIHVHIDGPVVSISAERKESREQKEGERVLRTERYYGNGLANAYLGDEDQGQMSAWFVMAALGLFQTDGGCRVDPIYEIGSPLFAKTVIHLGQRYGRGGTFTIEARNTSRKNTYVQSATLNGHPLETFWFRANELLKGGTLVLEMGPEPNKTWGIGDLPTP